MSLEIVPAYEIATADQAEIFNSAFEGYLAGWAKLDAAGVARSVFMQGADLWLSRFARLAGRLVGFGYVGRTGDTARLAGMGVIPEARGRGVGRSLLRQLLDEARARGDRLMTLEVFEQNPPAVALYRQNGFSETGRLFGWRSPENYVPPVFAGIEFAEQPVIKLLTQGHAREYPDLPWQVSRHALTHLPPLARAFSAGADWIVLCNLEGPTARIGAAISTGSEEMNWRRLRDLGAAVLRRFPGRRWIAPAFFPEEFGRELFQPLGLEREKLNQLLMRRGL